MEKIDIKSELAKLEKITTILKNEELSLRDIVYFEDQLDECLNNIKDSSREIIEKRFYEILR